MSIDKLDQSTSKYEANFPLSRLPILSSVGTIAFNVFNKFYFHHVAIEGRDHIVELDKLGEQGTIITGNHPSIAATITLFSALLNASRTVPPDKRHLVMPHALAKQELFFEPLGTVLCAAGQIPTDRAHGGTVYSPAKSILKQGGTMVIYPEGTCSDDPLKYPEPATAQGYIANRTKHRPEDPKAIEEAVADALKNKINGRYKYGMAQLAIATGARVVPVATVIDSVKHGANVNIRFGEAITAEVDQARLSTKQQRSFTSEIMLTIAEMMADMRGEKLPDEVRRQILAG